MKKVQTLPHSGNEVKFKNIEDVLKYTESLKLEGDVHVEALFNVIKQGQVELVKMLLAYNRVNIHTSNDYALRCAVNNGNTEIVKLLLEHGADIHANNDEALRKAVTNKNTDMVKLLISRGANTLSLTKEQHKSMQALLPSLPEVVI
jgi:ankyrin repeat protein